MLTPKMLQLYGIMKEYKDRNGYIPSYDEMAEMLGLKSKSGIHRLIVAMEKRGALRRLPNQSRAIQLLPLN